ncbi:hypothetical protein BB560_000240 [Smittium megazygosporum]|uniref:Sepiapterin reductase n=1 Tax=Smittium megazygosporum TaxID=133381 RepID=A0A2T9ZKX5_9FUNG|nr:hypothetical protein BB560_000240 [Smittium megazygosporum]
MESSNHLVLITGSGSGFGECIATTLPTKLQQHFSEVASSKAKVFAVLVGRSYVDLEKVSNKIKSDSISVEIVDSVELNEVSKQSYEKVVEACKKLEKVASGGFETITMIHNAGTAGDVSKRVDEYDDIEQISRYYNINLVSFVALNSMLLRWAMQTQSKKILVVQISSLLAVKAFPNWGLYASAKSARDQLLAVAAEENISRVKTLSYAPGPLDNKMQQFIRENIGDEDQKCIYSTMFNENQLVSMQDSVDSLVKLVLKDEFTSGSHIDYFDTL